MQPAMLDPARDLAGATPERQPAPCPGVWSRYGRTPEGSPFGAISTLLVVDGLAQPDMLIEVEAWAEQA